MVKIILFAAIITLVVVAIQAEDPATGTEERDDIIIGGQ